jgi:VWFA-related protein
MVQSRVNSPGDRLAAPRRRLLSLIVLCALAALLRFAIPAAARSQTPPAAPETSVAAPPATEVVTKDAPATFTSRVNLVPITVVVRDEQGRAVGNLTKDSFRLFDNGKPQIISRFTIEKPGVTPVVLEPESTAPGEPAQPASAAAVVIATRFTVYLFDDVHTQWEDLSRVREAAGRFLASSMQPSDRAAIYTTSGQTMLDFTSDQDQLQATLLRLQPRPVAGAGGSAVECPYFSYYIADMLVNKQDPSAIAAARAETMSCYNLNPSTTSPQMLDSMWQSVAQQALTRGDHETRLSLDVLAKVVRRLSAMPGQRNLVLASPGFLTPDRYQELGEVINRAIRANVIISSLDARGLWTPPGFGAEATTPRGGGLVLGVKTRLASDEALAQEDVLSSLASGTGGTFIHNTNDLAGGLRQLAAAPDFIYVLGFSPSNLKSDGKFHSLKVVLVTPKGLSLQARRGYYAPTRQADAAAQAHQEIEDALFNREVLKDFPVELHTQFFKSSDVDAKLSVVARVDFSHLRYRREEGRNRNSVTVVSALFDPNGNYLKSYVKVLDLRLKDETLANFERRFGAGIAIKSTFDVKSGASYVVRLVVRDSEGQMMAAENGAVEIP